MYHIVFNCDDNYVKFTAALMANIVEMTNKDSIESKGFNGVILREHNPLLQNTFANNIESTSQDSTIKDSKNVESKTQDSKTIDSNTQKSTTQNNIESNVDSPPPPFTA